MESTPSIEVVKDEKLHEKIDTEKLPSYFCLICYNNVHGAHYTLPCEHTYCYNCLQAYIESNIMSGQIMIKCFHVDNVKTNGIGNSSLACNTLIPESTVLDILQENPEYIRKFHRFKFLKSNANGRECPHCSYFENGDPSRPAITCQSCQQQYCFFHALAHPSDVSCSDYEKSIASQNEVKI